PAFVRSAASGGSAAGRVHAEVVGRVVALELVVELAERAGVADEADEARLTALVVGSVRAGHAARALDRIAGQRLAGRVRPARADVRLRGRALRVTEGADLHIVGAVTLDREEALEADGRAGRRLLAGERDALVGDAVCGLAVVRA